MVHALSHGRRISHVSVRADGAWLATTGAAKVNVNVWDLATGKMLFSLPQSQMPDWTAVLARRYEALDVRKGHSERVGSVNRRRLDAFRFDESITTASFSPDGNLIAVVAGRSVVKVYDVAGAAPVGTGIRHENYFIDHVAFADSTTLLVAGGGYLRVWDARRAVPRTPPLTHGPRTNVVCSVASNDGELLATAANPDGTVRVWHSRTARALTPPLRHGPGLREVVFDCGGSRIVTAGGDSVRVWPLSGGGSADDAGLARYARIIAARQIDTTGGIVPFESNQLREAGKPTRPTRTLASSGCPCQERHRRRSEPVDGEWRVPLRSGTLRASLRRSGQRIGIEAITRRAVRGVLSPAVAKIVALFAVFGEAPCFPFAALQFSGSPAGLSSVRSTQFELEIVELRHELRSCDCRSDGRRFGLPIHCLWPLRAGYYRGPFGARISSRRPRFRAGTDIWWRTAGRTRDGQVERRRAVRF